jgi:hypothetical protein
MSDKKTTGNVVALVNPEEQARVAFSNHVQSVAFQMSLSRLMVEGLQMVRDWGHQWNANSSQDEGKYSQRLRSHAVSYMESLIRRGLVFHDFVPHAKAEPGHRYYKLTRAGGLMCELLVEAGLIPAAKSRRKKA